MVNEIEDRLALDDSEEVHCVCDVNAAVSERRDLIEQSQGVTVGTVRGTRDEVKRRVARLDLLLARNGVEDLDEVRDAGLSQSVVL